ncbi:MAG: hypothetical protein KAG66_18830, partial [Methylococcales bacterium]|nr:hypothetical protein [Methylococcales bacterium]
MANQPANYNNIMPVYGSNGRILFVSDRARNGQRHLYPQHDEYENEVTNTGIWSLNPQSGNLFLLQHSPSGSFSPIVDSYGRVIFTRWDHLQRDQQADSGSHGTFDYANESAGASKTLNSVEVFPEPRAESSLITDGNTNLVGLRINHFFPWMIAQDGTGEETLNHIGRHELHDYFTQVFDDDNNLVEFNPVGRLNQNTIDNMFQIEESKITPGKYSGIDAPEFDTHTSGQIISMQAQPGLSADAMVVTYETHRDTESVSNNPSANHSGHYRDPLPMSNGSLLASHTSETRGLNNEGTRNTPQPRYDFSIKLLAKVNGYLRPTAAITAGISRSLSYWDPDQLVSYSGPMWELNPVEVINRSVPSLTQQGLLSSSEQSDFDDENVNVAEFKQFLIDQNLALMVVRDATSRDDADEQQPYNLRVPNGGKQVTPSSGTIYDIAHLQYFQADQVRGIGGMAEPKEGRRPLARVLHEQNALSLNCANPLGPAGSVGIQPDGSSAAFVPVRRAMVWQTTDAGGTPVVRERVWITFQPGEIRVCDGCHGINDETQDGQS